MSRTPHLPLLSYALLTLSLGVGVAHISAQTPDPAQTVPPATQPATTDPAAQPQPPSQPVSEPRVDRPQTTPDTVSPPATPQPSVDVAPPPTAPRPDATTSPDAAVPDLPPAADEMSADEPEAPSDHKNSGPKEAKDKADKGDTDEPLPASSVHNPILWHDPGNISSKNLFYGVGGTKNMPRPPFTFLEEDKSGTNPKFDVRDAKGKKWRVKLGEEARPEVVASRLLWAVGFYANDDYNLPSADISGLKLTRGKLKSEHIEFARFERKPAGKSKIGTWKWKENPFLGTQEFDGLRVMMAVMNNWDLKDINNSVYADSKSEHQIFLVNDVGATFATNNLQLSRSKDKGNIESFEKSKFITKTTPQTVSFATPAAPTGVLLKTFGVMSKEYVKRAGFQWIGQDIPREHAHWMGQLLGRLSNQQIRDAFRAGNFPPDQIDMYVMLVHNRIMLLQEL